MPGTPRVPMTNPYRADYYRHIAEGYSHAQAEWMLINPGVYDTELREALATLRAATQQRAEGATP